MGDHTARLIVTIIFLIFAVSSLVTRYWFSAFFWALLTVAVGYPFVQGGKLDLYYDTSPKSEVIVVSPTMTATPIAPPAPVTPSAPAAPAAPVAPAPVAPAAPAPVTPSAPAPPPVTAQSY